MNQVSLWTLIFRLSIVFGPCGAVAQVQSHFLLSNESFLSPQFEATEQNQYQFLGLRLNHFEDSESLVLDTEAVMAVDAPVLSYFKIVEASYEVKNGPEQSFSLGRKKKAWSSLDQRWSLGVIQPVFRWNPLNRESVGLTGFFWNIDRTDFSFSAFWSPLFFPDQGPNYDINSNGQFSKSNPWFPTPPKTFRPFPGSDASSTIQYNITRPPDSEIVLQSSLGGSLEKSWGDQFLTRTSYFYKPMNQLALGYSGSYVLASDQGDVDILPKVTYHRVVSLDGVYKSGNLETGISLLRDDPSNPDFSKDEDRTHPVLESALISSAYLQVHFRRQSLSFEVLNIDGGQIEETGDLASASRAPITTRYPFYQATRLRYLVKVPLRKLERLEMDLSWTHSDRNQFDLVQVKGHFHFKKRWQAFTDMQFVKAEPLTAKNHNDISSYDNNDRLMVGVAYEL